MTIKEISEELLSGTEENETQFQEWLDSCIKDAQKNLGLTRLQTCFILSFALMKELCKAKYQIK